MTEDERKLLLTLADWMYGMEDALHEHAVIHNRMPPQKRGEHEVALRDLKDLIQRVRNQVD